MERLTETRDNQNVIPLRNDGEVAWFLSDNRILGKETMWLYGKHADVLSDYESTGMKPCEIKQLQTENASLRARLEKAVELPCKVGDTVYVIGSKFLFEQQDCDGCKHYHEGSDLFKDYGCCLYKDEFDEENPECFVIYIWKNASLDFLISKINDFGKTVFLTEAEAQAKLDEMKGGAKIEKSNNE